MKIDNPAWNKVQDSITQTANDFFVDFSEEISNALDDIEFDISSQINDLKSQALNISFSAPERESLNNKLDKLLQVQSELKKKRRTLPELKFKVSGFGGLGDEDIQKFKSDTLRGVFQDILRETPFRFGEAQEVSLLEGGRQRGFTTPESLAERGFVFPEVIPLPTEVGGVRTESIFERGESIRAREGQLLRVPGTQTVFSIEAGKRRGVTSAEALVSKFGPTAFQKVKPITQEELTKIPLGQVIT